MKETYPLPEAITIEPWEVVGGDQIRRLPHSRRLVIPLSPDQHDQVLRTHELAHIKWSPNEVPKELNPAILSAVEDARINTKAVEHAGVDYTAGYPPALLGYTVHKLLGTEDRWGALIFSVAMTGMPQAAKVDVALESLLKPEDRTLLNAFRIEVRHVRNTFEGFTVRWTQALEEHIQNAKALEQAQQEAQAAAQQRRSEAEREAHKDFTRQAEKQAQADIRPLRDWRSEMEREYHHAAKYDDSVRRMSFQTYMDRNAEMIPWGRMEVQEPARSMRMPGRFGRQRRPSDSGAMLSYPQRLWQDQKVFGRKLRGFGGAVLVDGSGSMCLSDTDIWNILRAAPGAVIAVYGSRGGETGVLKILAKRGLCVPKNQVRSPGGANVVDYPALLWLAKQEEPRVWVSDGAVTGHHDRSSARNQQQCFEVCAHSRILRVPNGRQAAQVLEDVRNRRIGRME